MIEENDNMTSDSQENNASEPIEDSSQKNNELIETWGERKGKKSFKFDTSEVKDIDDLPVHPYLYKIKEQKTINGKEVIVLKLNGQEEERQFYKEELYKHFPRVSVKKQYGIYCTEYEIKIVREFLNKIVRDEKYREIFNEKNNYDITEIISMLGNV